MIDPVASPDPDSFLLILIQIISLKAVSLTMPIICHREMQNDAMTPIWGVSRGIWVAKTSIPSIMSARPLTLSIIGFAVHE